MNRLREWVEAQISFPETLRVEEVEKIRAQRLGRLENGPALHTIEADGAFLAWDLQGIEQDTKAPLALLWARQGQPEQLRPLLDRSREELEALPLMASALSSESDWSKLLGQKGFIPWRHFVSKPMSLQTVDAEYQLREAVDGDRPFFSALAAQNAVHTLPPGQGERAGAYRSALLQRILRLKFGTGTSNELLIAEDPGGQRVGYLWLDTASGHTAYVVDIGVEKTRWGQQVAQFLVLSAENALLARGFDFYVGEISAANHRSYHVATEICGFSPNRVLWRLSP